ncbi:MAG: glucose-6-phosphate dehydrogenase, partial [Rhodobiaceae bacterium]|nr:glucose-6-phosphate dehydrogenase [Rhodobiaceae bacterium]
MPTRSSPVEPFDLVVFGGTGDLARRKLLPALYERMRTGDMPESSRIIGAARSNLSRKAYQAMAEEALNQFVDDPDPEVIRRTVKCVDYVRVDGDTGAGFKDMKQRIDKEPRPIRAVYLAVGPSHFAPIAEKLKEENLLTPDTRLVVEKPLGHDLESARDLNRRLASVIDEHHIYRIDHYLGKETVQNLMAL